MIAETDLVSNLRLSVQISVLLQEVGDHGILISSTGVDDRCGAVVVLKVNLRPAFYQHHRALHIAP